MFTSLVTKTKKMLVSRKVSFYIRVLVLTLVLISTLAATSPALAGPMPGGIGG